MKTIRFYNTKAKRIIKAREQFFRDEKWSLKSYLFSYGDPSILRVDLIKSIDGFGFKEASHYLRNIRMGKDFAILDRHILRFMVEVKLIEKLPTTINAKSYIEYEALLINFCYKIGIPIEYFDFVIWYRSHKEVLK